MPCQFPLFFPHSIKNDTLIIIIIEHETFVYWFKCKRSRVGKKNPRKSTSILMPNTYTHAHMLCVCGYNYFPAANMPVVEAYTPTTTAIRFPCVGPSTISAHHYNCLLRSQRTQWNHMFHAYTRTHQSSTAPLKRQAMAVRMCKCCLRTTYLPSTHVNSVKREQYTDTTHRPYYVLEWLLRTEIVCCCCCYCYCHYCIPTQYNRSQCVYMYMWVCSCVVCCVEHEKYTHSGQMQSNVVVLFMVKTVDRQTERKNWNAYFTLNCANEMS